MNGPMWRHTCARSPKVSSRDKRSPSTVDRKMDVLYSVILSTRMMIATVTKIMAARSGSIIERTNNAVEIFKLKDPDELSWKPFWSAVTPVDTGSKSVFQMLTGV